MAHARAHIFVSGRVQGVFFRSFTEDVAVSCGLKGWVRNLPDGRVEALLEGERESIERAISSCRKGPPAARVDSVEVKWEEYKGEFKSFSVRFY